MPMPNQGVCDCYICTDGWIICSDSLSADQRRRCISSGITRVSRTMAVAVKSDVEEASRKRLTLLQICTGHL